MGTIEQALGALLMYGLLPLWAAAAVGDWLCHRAQRMEETAGIGEAVLHGLMLATLGPATLAVLLLDITAAVLAWVLLACATHELLFWLDLRYATRHRVIGPLEQWFHCIQFAVPWAGAVMLCLLNLDDAARLFNRVGPAADWALRLKPQPLPPAYLAAALVGSVLCVVLPFIEELGRCLRAARLPVKAPAWPPSDRRR